jgi:uncharacterized protein (TIGR02453 family)
MAKKSNESYFSPDLFGFLMELRDNNDREWFAANKARYEETVRDPFLRFIADLEPLLHGVSPSIMADPRPTGGSLFRIHRDIRFSKDKSPYKTHVAARFPHVAVKRDVHAPGFYLHLEPGRCFMGAGMWRPDARALTRVRLAIVGRNKNWQSVLGSKLEVEGDKLARPPRGFDPDHPHIEYLKLKDFVASIPFSEKEICGPRFLFDFVAGCQRMVPLMKFLATSLELEW